MRQCSWQELPLGPAPVFQRKCSRPNLQPQEEGDLVALAYCLLYHLLLLMGFSAFGKRLIMKLRHKRQRGLFGGNNTQTRTYNKQGYLPKLMCSEKLCICSFVHVFVSKTTHFSILCGIKVKPPMKNTLVCFVRKSVLLWEPQFVRLSLHNEQLRTYAHKHRWPFQSLQPTSHWLTFTAFIALTYPLFADSITLT